MYVPPSGGTPVSSLYIGDCNPETADTPCEPPPGEGNPGQNGVYLPSGGTMGSCTPNPGVPIADESQDHDQDGVQDQCEYELAQAFHPQMQFMTNDCQTGREPYWAVNRINSPIDGKPVIQVFYAIGYYYDCGCPCPGCRIYTGCASHFGDSEFIVLEVSTADYPTYDGPNWLLRYATLSAHYGTLWNSTGTYAGSDLSYGIATTFSNPFVWVAEGKHGNYRSQSVCDAGSESTDNCDSPGQRVGLEVLPEANLGSFYNQSNARVASRVGGPYSGTEHMWSTDNASGDGFLGWFPRSYGAGETPYGQLLINYGFY